uniref:Putative peptide/nickel/opine uptake family ABC transporter n=1 Tax=Arthrobacter globiformis TaxID=1665 RepID=B8R4L0_ARTGO|nr:putative peptide/nickel/opine uptake family ABC transporter [Arthrobacter globiformis]
MNAHNSDAPLLIVRDLSIDYEASGGRVHHAVLDVDFKVHRGEIFGLAGESGSGKSTIANTLLGLLGAAGRVVSGSVHFEGQDVLALQGETLRRFRWNSIAMVFQSAMNALNPVMTVGDQIVDVLMTHKDLSRKNATVRAKELLAVVGLKPEVSASYPHQLSGGMRQRAVIAVAIALNPDLLILDEPTTALDVVVQQEVIQEIRRLQAERGFAVLFITHDIALMAEVSDEMAVMRHGRIVERGHPLALFANPGHEYTRELVHAFPPITREAAAFHDDGEEVIAAADGAAGEPKRDRVALVTARGLVKTFVRRGSGTQGRFTAVDHVDFDLERGEILALVGESGSGKSTVARALARLEHLDEGHLTVDGRDAMRIRGRRDALGYRSAVQLVFQDPFSSLNPAHRVQHFLERPIVLHRRELRGAARRAEMESVIESVGLEADVLERFPHELSGGQRQRIAVARALIAQPSVILADEPTSMLDVSVRMGILNLMKRIRDERGIAVLFITHDLASARYVADRTMVMLSGRLVEGGRSADVMDDPRHPYTRLLVSAAPEPGRLVAFDPQQRVEIRRQLVELTAAVQALPPEERDGREVVGRDHWIAAPDARILRRSPFTPHNPTVEELR